MHSPFEAVYGHDRTHVRRMTVSAYLHERDAPSQLSSRDPNVEFYSKYPLRDRFGRELCVLYQILEMDVQHELRRVERGGAATRQSGVRLSAEIPFGDSDTPKRVSSSADVTVSASSADHSTTASAPRPRASVPGDASGRRVSSFLIPRDSGLNPRTQLPEPRGVAPHLAQTAPMENGSEEEARPTCVTLCGEEAWRFPTIRPSELRTTKQLFVGLPPRRTLRHAAPIPCQAYGVQSASIRLDRIAALVESNLEAAVEEGGVVSVRGPPPLLRPGAVIELDGRRLCVGRYYTSADVYEATDAALPGSVVLLYHWGVRAARRGANEARRAFWGMHLAAPHAKVTGCAFDAGGVTAVTLPAGFGAVPLSHVPLGADAFATCVRLMLRVLSDLVARRTVHGGLRGLNCVFLAMPRSPAAGTSAFLVPVHWEEMVDFGMFVDRNAGRTIPLTDGDDEDEARGGRLVYHSHDIDMVLRLLLENELAEHLTAEQLEAMRHLVHMTAQPTQIANYLIQLKNVMTVIPPNMTALFRDFEVAMQCL